MTIHASRTLPSLATAAMVFLVLASCGESPGPSVQAEAPGAETTPAQPRTDMAAVDAFNAYRLNASAGLGAEALEHVHPSYFEMVQRHIDMALDADRATVEALPFFDRFMVFSMRVRVEPQVLRTITPRAFAELAIDEGWIESEIIAAAMVESVELLPEGSTEPETAEITMSLGGRVNPTTMPMIYEGGRWLVDLRTMTERSAASAEKMVEMMGDDADDIVVRGLAAKEGKPVPQDIYAPIGRE